MTAKERAEKIESIISMAPSMTIAIQHLARYVEEAEREAFKRLNVVPCSKHDFLSPIKECSCSTLKSYAEGFKAAREKAVGVADELFSGVYPDETTGKMIADRIRKMEPGE
jgi:hypothetical protein